MQVKKFQSMHNRAMERSELCAKLITATNSEVQLAPLLLAATGGACQLADCSHSLLCVPHRRCGAQCVYHANRCACMCMYRFHPSIDVSIHRNGGLQSLNAVRSTRAYACGARGAEATFLNVASSRFARSVLARCLSHLCLLPRSILPRSCCILYACWMLHAACRVLRALPVGWCMLPAARNVSKLVCCTLHTCAWHACALHALARPAQVPLRRRVARARAAHRRRQAAALPLHPGSTRG